MGSLGHVLGHGLPHFVLQVCQLLPVCLQLQPLIIWHLKEDTKEGCEIMSEYLLIISECLRECT